MASQPAPFILDVIFERRDDGGLRAYCDKVPGFVLSHANADAVLADVEPALETILSAMYGLPVSISRADVFGANSEPTVPAHLCSPAHYVGQQHNA